MPVIKKVLNSVSVDDSPLPAGSYVCEVASIEQKPSKSDPNFDVLEVQYVCVHEGFQGRRMRQWITLKDNALFSFKRFVTRFGIWDEDDVNDPSGFEFDTDEVIGKEIGVLVVNGFWDGKPRTEIDRNLYVEECEGEDPNAPKPDVEPAGAPLPDIDETGDTETVDGGISSLFS